MPDRSDALIFLGGLIIYLAGQVIINLMGAVSRAQTPIDYSHWLMLIGAVLMLPFALRRPMTGLNLLIAPVLVLGVVSVIGMCVIDLVFWSLPDVHYRNDLAVRLIDSPGLWRPFMQWGPNEVFTLGVALPALLYWGCSRAGVGLVALGAFLIAIGPSWFNVSGYTAMVIGYTLAFQASRWRGTTETPEAR